MNAVFYISAAIAVVSTLMVISRKNAVHSLMYLVLSFLSLGIVFFCLGAPFIAALEVIIYAGAIMVLFLFVVMMLNTGVQSENIEKSMFDTKTLIFSALLAGTLLAELVFVIFSAQMKSTIQMIEPKELSLILFGPYVLGVELASMLLLAGLLGAYHIGKQMHQPESTESQFHSETRG